MANHFSTCRIRLNGETNGTGFLITDGYVLTCTHVVQAAIKNPEVKITVSFQRSDDKNEIPATVPHFTPLDDDKAYRDIAVLALAKAPNDSKVMPLPRNHQSELAEHPFAACGFRHDIGEITTGIIAENENKSLMQLNFGDIPIVGGYSGAPVWAEKLDAVVGMVTWSMTKNTAYCISMRYIADIWANEFKLPALPEIFSHNPYKGLDYFHTADADRFYGRDEEIASLYETIQQQHFIAVVGNSGTGKSSVVFAGLVPKLDEVTWCVLATRPADDPFHYLAKALVDHFEKDLSDLKKISEIKDYKAKLQQGSLTLADVATMEKDSRARQLVLIIDQFEELYTLNQDKANDVQAYLEHLMAAIASQKLRIIITLRTDFLSNTHQTPDFAKLIETYKHNIYLIKEAGKLEKIIDLPDTQGRARVQLEAGLKNKIIKDTKGELALLQFALEELWQRRENNSLTHAAYTAIGGVDGALERKAENFMKKLPKEEQQQVRLIMLKLLKLGEGTEDTRKIATKSEIGEDNWAMVSRLADQRLVKTKSEKGEETAEVIHEVLIRNWTTLNTWLTEDVREFLRWHDELRAQFKTWQESGQPKSGLLTGLQLVKAEDYVENIQQATDSPTNLLSKSELNYIEQSTRRAKSQKNRTVLAALAILIVTLFITNRITLLNNYLNHAKEINLVKGAISLADTLSEKGLSIIQRDWVGGPDGYRARGMLMLNEAKKLSEQYDYQSSQINSALLSTLLASTPVYQSYLWNDGINEFIVRNDTEVLTLEEKKVIRQWNIKNKDLIAVFESDARAITNIAISRDGKLLSTSSDKGVVIWDIDTQKIVRYLPSYTNINSLTFNHSANLLALGDKEGSIFIYDLEKNEEINKLMGNYGIVTHIKFWGQNGLVIASSNKYVSIWNSSIQGNARLDLNRHTAEIFAMVISPNERYLASRSVNETFVWDLADINSSPKKIPEGTGIVGDGSEMKTSLAFSSDSKTLAIGNLLANAADIVLWNIDKNTEVMQLDNTDSAHGTSNLKFSSDGHMLVGASPLQQYLSIWHLDASENQVVKTINISIDDSAFFIRNKSFAFSVDGTSMLTMSDDEILQYDIATNVVSKSFLSTKLSGDEYGITTATETPLLAYKDIGKNIILWNYDNGESFTVNHIKETITGSFSLSPDGQWLAVANKSDFRTINLWNLRDLDYQNYPHTLLANTNVTDIIFTSDSKRMITTGFNGMVTFWVWRSNRWDKTKVIKTQSTVGNLDMSNDGTLLAAANTDILVWDMKTHKEILFVEKFSDGSDDVSFNHDATLMSFTDGHHIHLWDMENRQEFASIDFSDTTRTPRLTFHPQENILAVKKDENKIMLIKIGANIWMEEICRRAGRNFFKAEWEEYFSSHPETWEDYVARDGTCPQYPVLESIEDYANLNN